MQPWCVGISTLLLSALLPWPGAGQFRVIGPGPPIIASVGKEAVLPCHLSPMTDAEDMQVTWYQIHPSALVHHYEAYQDQLDQQSPKFQERTEFIKENITTGQVALRIFPILPADNGQYRCYFASSTFENEAQFTVLVTASGRAPQIHIESGGTGEMKLTCTSPDWYPEPEVQWRDLQGRRLTPASETKTAAENGLFHVETSVTVDTRSRDVSCVIRNPVLTEEKEAHVSVADTVFPRIWPWIVEFVVSLCLVAVGTAFGVLFVQTRRKLDTLPRDYDLAQKENVELNEDIRHLVKENGLKNLRSYAEDITLDERTAHPHLEIRENRKYVRATAEKRDVPDNPERFDTHMAVLGMNRFSAGDHYWEVDVGWKDRWEIGLCVHSVTRKGEISVCPENGFWALSLENNEYKALSTPTSILSIPDPLMAVGIFLQYEKGLISFYNVPDCSFLYTFKTTFNKPLKPYFYPGPVSTENMGALIIPKCQ
ncbi:butyrophilin subfamily 1 member A1-like [Erinaceus europaeus]|uniref:Butyrophilin subfamily 1 member A1-like n=1 Tax=Erinaceus europaeus TaxID=9365 RepID=A0ABM3XVR7_ERIEU|nr:butyrophilin subfamily 1 member A1-like [Erinaceus europaeus]